MKNKRIFLLTNLLLPIPSFLSIACTKNVFTFSINKPWSTNELNFKFFDKIIKEYNNLLKNNNLNSVKKYNISYKNNNNDLAQELIKGSATLASITSSLFYRNKEHLSPLLQTQTYAFKFDLDGNKYYSSNNNGDDLVKIAKEAQKMFERKKFNDWGHSEYGWDGSKFNYFYSKDLIDFYRGNIMMWGNKSTIERIKKAWVEKDWNTFRNFGIMTGKENSASKYLLQEQLFKKHFNLPNNEFTSFALDRQKNPNKYKIDKAKNLSKGENKNYHIVFDELGSFAYTNNKKNNKQLNYYSCENPEDRIEFLTVTDPIKYNVLATSNSLSEKKRELLAKAIYNIWKNGYDDYGKTVGFNGYKIIKNYYKEVIEPYKRVFDE